MRAGTAPLGLAIFVLVLASIAAGGEPKNKPASDSGEHTLVGEIRGVNVAARSFTVKETFKGGEAKLIRFELADDAVILIHGQRASLDEIRSGDSVTVKYVEKEGHRIARACDVAKPAG